MLVWVALAMATGLTAQATGRIAPSGAGSKDPGWFGFYAVFDFVTFFLAVLAGKELRKVLMRPEDYYDR